MIDIKETFCLDPTEWSMVWDYEQDNRVGGLIPAIKLIRERTHQGLYEAKKATDFAREQMRAGKLFEDYKEMFDVTQTERGPGLHPLFEFQGKEVRFNCPCGCFKSYVGELPAAGQGQEYFVPIEGDEEEEPEEKEDEATIKMKLSDLKKQLDEARVRSARQQDGVDVSPEPCTHSHGGVSNDGRPYCSDCGEVL